MRAVGDRRSRAPSDSGRRVTFVGRRQELDALIRRFDRATAGEGGVIVVAGEPGIGKTAMVSEFASRLGPNPNVLLGTCYEGEWQRVLGPWVQAIGAYARVLEPSVLLDRLGKVAPVIAQFVPEVAAALPQWSERPQLSAEEERFRLYEGVFQFLSRITESAPTVLLLEDLHWADADSLSLLRYLARALPLIRLLVVGTYRQTDVQSQRKHPLPEVLADLARERGYERLSLKGLSIGEVKEYLDNVSATSLPADMVTAIHEETAGNPFFVKEVFRHLVEEGRVGTSTRVADRTSELGIPDSVKLVLAKRMSRLPGDTNEMLMAACAFTGGFELPVLQSLTGLSEDDLLRAIDDALDSGLIVAVGHPPTLYDFAHALVRNTLVESLNPDRRARLHRRVAEAIEGVYASREYERASELAAQYHESRTLPGSERGVQYAIMAADLASASAAYDRAVALLHLGLDLVPLADAPLRANVIQRLAIAQADALMLDDAAASARQALTALRDAGETAEDMAGFLVHLVTRLKTGGARPESWEPLIDEGIRLVGTKRDLTWARLTLLLDPVDQSLVGAVNLGVWRGHDREAVAIARSQGTEDDYARTLEPYEWRSPEETREALKRTEMWTSPSAVIRALDVVIRDLVHRHDATIQGQEVSERMLRESTKAGSIPGQVEGLVQLAFCHGVLGNLEAQDEALRAARQLVARLGSKHRLQRVVESGVPGIRAFLLRDGDWKGIAKDAAGFISRQETARTPLGFVFGSVAVLANAFDDNKVEAVRLLNALTPALLGLVPTAYHKATTVDFCTWAIWELGLDEFAESFLTMALELMTSPVAAPLVGSHALCAARASALLGKFGDALQYFELARKGFQQSGRRPLLALTDLDQARTLMRSGSSDLSRINALLEASTNMSRTLGMIGWERLARQLRERLSKGSNPGGLTGREAEILTHLASGRTNKEIATDLYVSVATVERHVANIYRKIGVRSRVEATAFALSEGLTASSGITRT